LSATKASVGYILFVKTVIFSIIVFHRHSLESFYEASRNDTILQMNSGNCSDRSFFRGYLSGELQQKCRSLSFP
jgi:hypothetical protein